MQKWHVLAPNVRSLEQGAVVDLICFCSTESVLARFLDVKNNIWRQVRCFWARNVTESCERWNLSGTRWSKTNKQLTLGVTVCFNGCQTSNVWRQNTSCLAPYYNTFFLVSCPRFDATDGIACVILQNRHCQRENRVWMCFSQACDRISKVKSTPYISTNRKL